ncbi:hypothetical protein AAP_04471 [Ascosphaera apis ARSEF 7405]|uniref:Uncharacterized protein n=1 Tax=Ascosphaera apis ARSEF 7405 TaxID=392613 RepID=A0A167WVA2_9EURO|nr:hypothetical protein AAP_04471 [Ascosphaera apis ARSEF 7405]
MGASALNRWTEVSSTILKPRVRGSRNLRQSRGAADGGGGWGRKDRHLVIVATLPRATLTLV